MDLRIALKLTVLEGKLFLRNYINVFFLLLFPSLILLLFGGMFGNEPAAIFGGYGTVDVSVPAYAGMIISVTGLMCLPLTLSEYREKKILKRFRATPLSPHYVIIAQIGVNLLMTVVGMLLLFITARIVFDLHFMGDFLPVVAVFLFSTLSIFSLGFLIAAVAPNMMAATAIAYLVYFPMLFLTGATIPIEMMPETMQKIAAVLPVTHVVKAMKAVWLGESIASVSNSLLLLAGITVVCFFLSFKLFRWE
ncbi:MAG TPA: ABC transporter permease [Firmicutes bacterium]|nr:ABC transporter permease [Bacillota bacterium]